MWRNFGLKCLFIQLEMFSQASQNVLLDITRCDAAQGGKSWWLSCATFPSASQPATPTQASPQSSGFWPLGGSRCSTSSIYDAHLTSRRRNTMVRKGEGDVKNFQQQMFSEDVCFSLSDLSASQDLVNRHEIRGLEWKRPGGCEIKPIRCL